MHTNISENTISKTSDGIDGSRKFTAVPSLATITSLLLLSLYFTRSLPIFEVDLACAFAIRYRKKMKLKNCLLNSVKLGWKIIMDFFLE